MCVKPNQMSQSLDVAFISSGKLTCFFPPYCFGVLQKHTVGYFGIRNGGFVTWKESSSWSSTRWNIRPWNRVEKAEGHSPPTLVTQPKQLTAISFFETAFLNIRKQIHHSWPDSKSEICPWHEHLSELMAVIVCTMEREHNSSSRSQSKSLQKKEHFIGLIRRKFHLFSFWWGISFGTLLPESCCSIVLNPRLHPPGLLSRPE